MLPLLTVAPTTQNARVDGFEVPNDDQPALYIGTSKPSVDDIQDLIQSAYRQIFSQHQMLDSHRQPLLESQLRSGQITVRDFIRGLATSDSFRRLNYDSNSNYRFVEICVQRLLGRDVYSDQEKIAWSIVIATQGFSSFIDILLNSSEYLNRFGYDTVPYQQRRVLAGQSLGETPFWNKTPRYDAYYRDKYTTQPRRLYYWSWQYPPYPARVRQVAGVVTKAGGVLVGLGVLTVILAYYGLISL